MSSPCAVCSKRIYPNDPSWSAEGKKWHKGCFKCVECGVLLVLRNAQVLSGVIYCEKHKPTDKPTQTADRLDLNTEKNKPKVATVNTNMRGELVGQKSSEGADSIAIGGRIQAGKLAQESRSVNDNVRGELAGAKPNMSADSLHITSAANAGKLAKESRNVNENVRGELAGAKSHLSADSMGIARSLETQKMVHETRIVNDQIRGASAGQQSNKLSQAVAVSAAPSYDQQQE